MPLSHYKNPWIVNRITANRVDAGQNGIFFCFRLLYFVEQATDVGSMSAVRRSGPLYGADSASLSSREPCCQADRGLSTLLSQDSLFYRIEMCQLRIVCLDVNLFALFKVLFCIFFLFLLKLFSPRLICKASQRSLAINVAREIIWHFFGH